MIRHKTTKKAIKHKKTGASFKKRTKKLYNPTKVA